MTTSEELSRLTASFTGECDFANPEWVVKTALLQASEMQDGLTKYLLLALADIAKKNAGVATPQPEVVEINPEMSQQELLHEVKSSFGTKITWPKLAETIGISARQMQTYILPADSKGYRNMPNITRNVLLGMLAENRKAT